MLLHTLYMQSTAVNVRLTPALRRRVETLQREAGISPSEQVRRALGVWLESQERFRSQLKQVLANQKGKK